MFENKKRMLCFILVMLAYVNVVNANTIDDLELIQVLNDDINGVDGLGNPRSVKVLANNSQVFVSSADDNAFAVFDVDNDFSLTFSQVFKNAAADIAGLEGASGLVYLENGNQVVVSGYYDGALSTFSRAENNYHFSQLITDGLGYDRVFDSDKPVGELDRLGLLGAWEVVKTASETQLIIASYMSNAIAIFDVSQQGKLTLNHVKKDAIPLERDLGSPITAALSALNDELYVLGFEGHQLTIFDRNKAGTLSVKQVIKNGTDGVEQFVNPQKIVVSPNGKFLYIACAGSHSLVVFDKTKTGKFSFLQAINNSDIGGSGLEGASSLAISSDGSTLYAAGEAGSGLYQFNVGVDGRLSYKNKLLRVQDNELKGISSFTLTDDNQHLLVATGKGNALLVFKVKSV